MPRIHDDDPLTEDEWPDEADTSDDDSVDLVRCNTCGKMIAEDSPQCPHCKTWGPDSGAAPFSPQRLVWIVVILLLIAVILIYWHGLGR